MKSVSILILVLIVTAGSYSTAQEFQQYPFELTDQIRAKFVFVGFPGGPCDENDEYDHENIAGDEILEDIHVGIVEQVRDYLASHSNGLLTFTEDSGILYRYNEQNGVEDPDDTDEYLNAWKAIYPACDYMTSDIFDSSYDFYSELHEWWTNDGDGYCTELFAEILWQIYTEYWIEASDPTTPFTLDGGKPWRIFFIFLSESDLSPHEWPKGPWGGGVGGRPYVAVNAPTVIDSTGNFFVGVEVTGGSNSKFEGSGQNGWNYLYGHDGEAGGEPIDPVDAIEANSRGILHEFVHTFNISDGPPNLATTPYGASRYYYGYLHLECQHYDFGEGIPPIGDPALQTIPWNRGANPNNLGDTSVIDVTGQNVRNLPIYDVRAGGQLVKISLGDYPIGLTPPQEEYFILAYHAGTGLDAQDRNGDPIVPSQGLAIWHCIGDDDNEDPQVYDLESASGRWDFGFPNNVVLEYDHPRVTWLDENPISGYDNYDIWPLELNPAENDTMGWRRDFSRYWGDVYDFFRNDLTGDMAEYNKSEFSFRSNPNTYGYSRDPGPGNTTLLRRPQEEINSLVIRIGEPGNDGVADFVTIDVSPAPWEYITFPPNGIETINPGEIYSIEWSCNYNPYISSVDIYYSRDKDGGAWTPLILNLSTVRVDSWDWFVGGDHSTAPNNYGQIRIDFHNTITANVASELSDIFVVSGNVVKSEDIISPTVGDELYENLETKIVWTAMFPNEWYSFRLKWHNINTGSEGYEPLESPHYESSTNEYWADWTPQVRHTGGQIELCIECTANDQSVELGAWTAPIVIYPRGYGFEDVSLPIMINQYDWYDGTTNAAIPIDVGSDDFEDFALTMNEYNDGSTAGAMIYRYIVDGSDVGFVNVGDVFGADIPTVESRGITAGDFNNDGYRDLVVCKARSDGVGIYLQQADGSFIDVTSGVFPDEQNVTQIRQGATNAVIIDANRDGRQDLFLATELDIQGGMHILLLNDFDAESDDLEFIVPDPETFSWPDGVHTPVTIAWADMDSDGWWNAFMGGAHAQLLTQNRNGYLLESDPFPCNIEYIEAACWADIDHEDHLDLVLATQWHEILVFRGQVQYGQNFSDDYYSIELPSTFVPHNLAAIDYDMDGWTDIVVTGKDDTDQTLLFLNLLGLSDQGYSEAFTEIGIPVGLGLDGSRYTRGIAPADYDGDYDVDLFVGRSETVGRVYANLALDQEEENNHWIAFDFDNAGQYAGAPYLGAVIAITDANGNHLSSTVIDGGRGQGGQSSTFAIVGLGAYGDNPEGERISYVISMPNVNDIVDHDVQVDQVIPITIMIPALEIVETSISCVVEVQPNTGLLDWRFNWNTNKWTPSGLDQVLLTSVSGCAFAGTDTLEIGHPDVSAAVYYQVDPETREIWYEHVLVWKDQPCVVPCRYTYDLQSKSGDGAELEEVANRTGKISVCPQSY